jgi:hypothetical protein
MTSVFGPDFLAIQVRDLQRSAGFYERYAIAIHGASESG